MFDFGFLPKGITLKKLIWLKASGIVGAVYQTFTGTIARFLSPSSKPVKSIVCNIEPVQDLHGYDNPWPAGGGKNKFSKGTISVTAVEEFGIDPVPAGTYVFSSVVTCTNTEENVVISFKDENGNVLATKAITPNTGTRQFSSSFTVNAPITSVILYSGGGWPTSQGNTSVWTDNMLADASVTSFSPYSNECPISGFTGLNVYGESEYDPTADPKVAVTWQSAAGTVYAGYISIDKGGNATLTAYPYYASYNGETLVGPWVSSVDEYEAGATPTTGAQVVDFGGTPTTYTLSSVTVPSTVQGENNWWHDANGNITIEAIGTPISSDEPDALQSLNILLGGAYTPRANFSEPTDEQALNIILGR